jgi:hypothetical protein
VDGHLQRPGQRGHGSRRARTADALLALGVWSVTGCACGARVTQDCARWRGRLSFSGAGGRRDRIPLSASWFPVTSLRLLGRADHGQEEDARQAIPSWVPLGTERDSRPRSCTIGWKKSSCSLHHRDARPHAWPGRRPHDRARGRDGGGARRASSSCST